MRRRPTPAEPARSDVDSALAALSADALREVVREMLLELDDKAHRSVINAGPSMLRLRRWLGSAGNKAALRKRASEALLACPKQAARQRAFLHVLQGEFEPAAKLLAAAPGLGWSDGEHPGHLLLPLFTRLLGGKKKATSPRAELMVHRGMDLEELEAMTADEDEPRLAAPEVDQLLELARISSIPKARRTCSIFPGCPRPGRHS